MSRLYGYEKHYINIYRSNLYITYIYIIHIHKISLSIRINHRRTIYVPPVYFYNLLKSTLKLFSIYQNASLRNAQYFGLYTHTKL